MKILCLLALPFFFLLFTNANAYLVNFTGSAPITLKTVSDVYDVKSRYFNNSWFISYSTPELSNYDDFYISRWNNGFTIKEKDWILLFPLSRYIDFILNTNPNLLYPINYNQFIFMTASRAKLRTGNFTYDLNYKLMTDTSAMAYGGSVAITSDMKYAYTDTGTVPLKWGYVKSVWGGMDYFTYSNGSLTIPNYVTSISGYHTIRFLYIPIINEYWLFYPDQDRNIWVSRYDSGMNYINTHKIADSSEIPENTYDANIDGSPAYLPTYPDFDVVYSEKYGYNVYMVTHLYGNNTIEFNAFDVISTNQIDSLVLVDYQIFNLADYESDLIGGNTTYGNLTQTLSLAYNPDKAHFNLFYWSNSNKLNVLEESVLCQCSAWVDTSECVGLNRKQIRTCVPTGCDAEIQYVSDASCQYTPPPLANSTKYYENSSLCINFGNTLGSTSKCEFNLQIPIQCQLNTVKVTLESHIEAQDNKQCDKGNYNITICNPSFSCNSYSHPCDEFNWTHSYVRLTYQPTDTALLQAIGYVPTSCGSYSCLWNGVNRWDFYASYKVECTIACYEHKICGSGDMFGYSCTERSDCTGQDCTFCNQGCYENTGECYVAGVTETTVTGAGGISDIGSFIKGGTENAFKGSPWMLNLIALGVTGGITVSLYVGGLKSEKILIGIMLGCVLFFLSIQWLNPLIGILWALSLALLYTQMFRSKLVG